MFPAPFCDSLRVLQPPVLETEEVFEIEVNKTPEPQPWIPQGSEREVDEEADRETRERVLQCIKKILSSFRLVRPFHLSVPSPSCHQLWYKFSRVRRNFGSPVCFSDRNTADAKDGYLECASYQDSRFSIKQMQRDCGMQAVPRLQSSGAQTQWYTRKPVFLCSLYCFNNDSTSTNMLRPYRKFQRNIFTQYMPRQLSDEEKENVLQSDSLKKFCTSVTPR